MDGEVILDGQNCVELEKLGISLMAVEDKIIVMFDDYKSGYECKTCNGKGEVLGCGPCGNTGKDRFMQECKVCKGKGVEHKNICPDCKGKGGILVIPETAKSLPTTGVVMSMGPDTDAMKYTRMIRQALQIIEGYKKFKPEEVALEEEIQNKNITNWKEELKHIPIRLGSRVILDRKSVV